MLKLIFLKDVFLWFDKFFKNFSFAILAFHKVYSIREMCNESRLLRKRRKLNSSRLKMNNLMYLQFITLSVYFVLYTYSLHFYEVLFCDPNITEIVLHLVVVSTFRLFLPIFF